MSSLDRMENRAVIKFCRDLGKTPTDAYHLIQKTPKKTSISRALVFKWYKRFEEGERSLKESESRGRKPKVSEATLTSLRDALNNDRRLTVRTLSEMFDVSVGTIHNILTQQLKMSKVLTC